jgi:quinol monooxygenase YgiN
MKVIAGIWQIASSEIENFKHLSQWVAEHSKKEEGYISYKFLSDLFEPNQFVFLEEWKDQAAIDFHVAQWYFKEFMEKASPMLKQKPVITIYEVTNMTNI